MVGLIDESFEKFPVNSRIKVNQNKGTVRYVGEVAGYSGTWLGIEWDDPKRGKHDGIVDGMRYFKTKHSTSGSMIRPGKVDDFESVEVAARKKYLNNDPNSFDKNLLQETQNHLHASIFEIVGMEKIARKQSKFEELFDISVADSNVNSSGNLSAFQTLSTLNLSSTLVWNWQTVGQILGQVPTLAYLNLSENRMQVPTSQEIRDLEPLFRNLKKLNLRDCGLDNWEDVKQTAELFPNIEMLGLQNNDISELTPVDCTTIFKNLKELHLHRTKLSNFSEILKLGNIKTLKSLFLMENNISEIVLPDCAPNEKLKIFPNLEILNLYFNPLKDSVQLFNELDKLAVLKNLNKSPDTSTGFEEMFSLAVGLITGLEVLNKVELTSEQKRGAQIDIWKKFATNWIQCEKNIFDRENFSRKIRAYEKLVEKFGSPIDFAIKPTKKSSNLITIKIHNKSTDEIWEKRLPKSLSIQSLQGLIIKRFNLNGIEPELSYVDAKNPKLVVDLDNCSKSLDFYSIQDGDFLVFSENPVEKKKFSVNVI